MTETSRAGTPGSTVSILRRRGGRGMETVQTLGVNGVDRGGTIHVAPNRKKALYLLLMKP
jgi:hypothetical protein